MTDLEELKEATRMSVRARANTLRETLGQKTTSSYLEPRTEQHQGKDTERESVSDTLLDLISDTALMYKLAVAQTRRLEDIDAVAKVWHDARAFYWSMRSTWETMEQLRILTEPDDRKLFLRWGEQIKKFESASAQAYEFHA